jgi:hypothetical protein
MIDDKGVGQSQYQYEYSTSNCIISHCVGNYAINKLSDATRMSWPSYVMT